MAIEAINVALDPQIQELSAESGPNIALQEDDAEKARKAAEKKLLQKKAAFKSATANRDSVQRTQDNQQKQYQQVLKGDQGAEAQLASKAWENNNKLQGKLSELQKNKFREHMAKNPSKGSKASQVLERLSKQPGFNKAVNSTQNMDALTEGVMENPDSESFVSEMLKSSFMQEPKSNAKTKNQFLKFGLQQAKSAMPQPSTPAQPGAPTLPMDQGPEGMAPNMPQPNVPQMPQDGKTPQESAAPKLFDGLDWQGAENKGPQQAKDKSNLKENLSRFQKPADAPKSEKAKADFMRFGQQQSGSAQLKTVKQTGDMLGSLNKAGVNSAGQQAALKMVQENPQNLKAMENVDSFVQTPNVSKMPTFAKSKAVEVLANAKGDAQVKEGMEELAGNKKFQSQTPVNKGRFFATIGSGRPNEMRQITDQQLQALKNPGFPVSDQQVGQFLGKMANQVKSGGAKNIDNKKSFKEVKTSDLPKPPTMLSTEGLSEEEALQVRSQNRARVIKYYNDVSRNYDNVEKKLNSAKYYEDVSRLQNMRMPKDVDVSGLSPEDAAFVMQKKASLEERHDGLLKTAKQKARELKHKRMPPAKRRAMQRSRRMQTQQPKYFDPSQNQVSGKQAFAGNVAQAGAPVVPSTPMQQQRMNQIAGQQGQANDLASMVQNMGQGQLSQVEVQAIATAAQAAAEAAVQAAVQNLISGRGGEVGAPGANLGTQQAPVKEDGQKGKVDGWGIPRSFERDLGGARHAVVKQPKSPMSQLDQVGDEPAPVDTAYTGKRLVGDPTSVRSFVGLYESKWKELSKSESALLRNLGWSQQAWDTKDNPKSQWPMLMATPFVNLNPHQRESVRKLGFSPHDWDKRVQAFTSGKNA